MIPEFDPRNLVPGMNQFIAMAVPPLHRVHAPLALHDSDVPTHASAQKQAALPRNRFAAPLSEAKPGQDQCTGPYRYKPYRVRKDYARRFLSLHAPPAVEGCNPDGTLFTVTCKVRHRFDLSEMDMFDLRKRYYSPRCRSSTGYSYPYGDRQIVHMIMESGKPGTYDPLQKRLDGIALTIDEDADSAIAANIQKLRIKDARSTARRNARRAIDREHRITTVQQFLDTNCLVAPEGAGVRYADLFEAFQNWSAKSAGTPSFNRAQFSQALTVLQHKRVRGTVLGLSIKMRAAA